MALQRAVEVFDDGCGRIPVRDESDVARVPVAHVDFAGDRVAVSLEDPADDGNRRRVSLAAHVAVREATLMPRFFARCALRLRTYLERIAAH